MRGEGNVLCDGGVAPVLLGLAIRSQPRALSGGIPPLRPRPLPTAGAAPPHTSTAFHLPFWLVQHHVVHGDNLWKIAHHYGVDLEELIHMNDHVRLCGALPLLRCAALGCAGLGWAAWLCRPAVPPCLRPVGTTPYGAAAAAALARQATLWAVPGTAGPRAGLPPPDPLPPPPEHVPPPLLPLVAEPQLDLPRRCRALPLQA
jgi:hypothetical protein